MIPAGDHSSRSLLLRRVSGWSEVTASHRRDESSSDEASEDSLLLDTRFESFDDSLQFRTSLLEAEIPDEQDDQEECTNESERRRLRQQPQHHSRNLLSPTFSPFFPTLEYEAVSVDDETASITSMLQLSERKRKEWKLWLVFFLLIVSGVGNVVLAKLQSLPMYNYPTFLNVYANFVYIIMSVVCYILPAIHFGWFHHSVSWRQLAINKKPFAVMGFLDALAAAMQVLSTIYLPGTLLVLLPQVAIPLSMIASRLVLRESFTWHQITGAAIVLGGIVVVLMPVLTHHRAESYYCQAITGNEDEFCSVCEMEVSEIGCRSHVKNEFGDVFVLNKNDTNSSDVVSLFCEWVSKEEAISHDDSLVFVWSIVMVASCIPMVFSTVYKQVALQVEMDPILVNCFVATFQLLFGIPLAIPAGFSSSPRVSLGELPENWRSATKCLFLSANTIDSGCHPDDCSRAALFVHLGLLSTAVYTISMMLVLKYGSASLLYLGLTLVVPLGHLIFSIHSPEMVHTSDIVGLVILLAGLVLYRFGHANERTTNSEDEEEDEVLAGVYQRLGDEEDHEEPIAEDPTTSVSEEECDETPRQGHHRRATITVLERPARLGRLRSASLSETISVLENGRPAQLGRLRSGSLSEVGIQKPGRHRRASTSEIGNAQGRHRRASSTTDSEGFLEFLREPFNMAGDV